MRSLEQHGENAVGSSKGYRNGTHIRALVISTGRLEEITVSGDREGQFHTQACEHCSRDIPHIAEELTQMETIAPNLAAISAQGREREKKTTQASTTMIAHLHE
jgi:hypothetical protein